MTSQQLAYELQQSEIRYNNLAENVRKLLKAKEDWMKDRTNEKKKQTYFAYEKRLKELIDPKPKSQAVIDWLAQ